MRVSFVFRESLGNSLNLMYLFRPKKGLKKIGTPIGTLYYDM